MLALPTIFNSAIHTSVSSGLGYAYLTTVQFVLSESTFKNQHSLPPGNSVAIPSL